MATTLEELVIKLEAENKSFIQAMIQSSTQTQKSMDAMTSAVTEMAKKGDKELSFFQQSMATMTGFLASSVVTGAFNLVKDAASQMFQTLVVDGVAASSEAIDNMNQLNQALARTGIYSQDVSEGFANWASELQKTTKFEDDAIIKSAAFIQTLGKLDQEGLKRATQGALDLSAALGIDLDTATKMVGKAAAGETASFSKLGIEIQKGSTDAQTFANTLQALSQFSGSATKAADTFSGAQARLANSFGEVQEQTGAAITQNVAVIEVMNAVGNAFFGASDDMNDSQQALRELVAEGLVVTINAVTGLIAVIDGLGRVASATFAAIQTVAYGSLVPTAKLMNMLGIVSDETFETLKIGAVDSAKAVAESFTQDTTLGKLGEQLAIVGFAAEEGLGKVKAGAVALPEVQNAATAATVELSNAMKALIAEGENLAKSYNEASISGKAMAEQQLADAAMVRDAKLATLAEEQEARLFDLSTIEERNAAELEIQKEFSDATLEANNMARQAELDAVIAAAQANKLTEEEKLIAIAGIQKKYGDMDMVEAKKLKDFKKKLDDEEVKNRESQISVLAGLQSSQNAYAKTVGKGFAVADTFIKTQQGAQAAYSALAGIPIIGPALGVAAAAAVVADGTSRIAAIRGAQTGITEVPGIGTRDTFGTVALAPGERVVPGETNQDLKEAISRILSGESGGAAQIQIMVGFKDEAFEIIETKMIERTNLGISVQGVA